MKKYQIIMPLFLPLALACSAAYMFSGRIDKARQYQDCLRRAKEYAQNGVVTDALAAYQEAIGLNPTLDVYLAIGELYFEQGQFWEAEKWCEQEILAAFPDQAEAYLFGLRVQIAQGNARDAFTLYDTYKARGLQDASVEELIQQVWYSFDLVGDYTEVKGFGNNSGLAAVAHEGRWGYINAAGTRVLPYAYQSAGTFGDLAPVVDMDGEAYYLDTAGNKKLTIPYFTEANPGLETITQFCDIQSGLILANDGEAWSYYDAETYQKKFGGYQAATVITNGVGAVSKNGSAWALISADGRELTGFDYQQILVDSKGVPCRTQAVIVEQAGAFRLLDQSGAALNGVAYEAAYAFNENSWAAVKKEGRWIFVDETGQEMDLGEFEEAKSFSNGAAAAKQDGKWGYINTEGAWIIEPQFYDAEPFFSSGVAFVKAREEQWQLLRLLRLNHG